MRDGPLTIYQWASVWGVEDVEERIDEMCAAESDERVLVDANVFVSFAKDDAGWDEAMWGGATWSDGGAGSHHD
jgi:hypothetical protein